MPKIILLALALLAPIAVVSCSTVPKPAAAPDPFYPDIAMPNRTGFLKVSENHTLYFEESGNPAGKPVVFLHGGPGSGTKPKQRRFFDPTAYRIILFDQAGAGKSQSADLLKENTTWELVKHLELLRKHLGVEKWQLFGGSWGSTLALAYAEAYPERVTEIITWGVFLSRPSELDWSYKPGGVSMVFPDAFAEFANFIPKRERGDLVKAYLVRLHSKDAIIRREAVRRWTLYEDVTATLLPQPAEQHTNAELDDLYLRRALIEAHYMAHGSFLSPKNNELLAHADRLRDIPIVVVAGRYDMICPHVSAWDLKAAAPRLELHLVSDAGHLSMAHPGVLRELLAAADRFRDFRQPSSAARAAGLR
ncbi:MAG: prolyl aminopeptidase [Deltaproteobacteria bacterium]|nr:prolyl aminopeptidase [Deltaproteobacteria bacterium]